MTNPVHSEEQTYRPIVGIDLGTTNSAIAFIQHGQPRLMSSPKKETIIPSVVLIDPKERVIVGEDARSALVAMPDRAIAAVKRKMGSEEPIVIAGQQLLPQEVSALILKELKTYADAVFGEGEKEAVITVPAYFTDAQRRATKQAGELAGFVVERIINEPTAAALAFGLAHLDEDKTFLVYDLGGGTFDVSVLEQMSGVIEVKASTGNNLLGGEDFDWKLVELFAERIRTEHGVEPLEDIRAKALLKEEAERVKKRLSAAEVVSVALPLVTVKDNRPVGLTLDVTREQFVALIEDKLEETLECVRSVLREAELQPEQIDEVLLVGGSTRIPRVQEKIVALLGKKVRTDVNPDEAVALGAAVQAGLKAGSLSDSGLVATDVAPYSMGIAVLKPNKQLREQPGGFAAIIERNTTIPVTRTKPFFTSAPGQTSVSIELYQGEHEWVKHNHLLGQFLLEGIPANLERQEQIEITFRYNLNGILETTAKCVSTGKQMTVTVQDGLNRESQASFRDSASRLEALWSSAPADDGQADEPEDWNSILEEISLPADLEDDIAQPDSGELRQTAERLLQRMRSMPDLTGLTAERTQAAIQRLEAARSADDLLALQEAIDDATDLLIELEF
ncbi:Hsp70 family protein [Cohnella fermenti]|uniref:Chaperone protein DnaK n=1 Tax=Cohnella fermenti TaxID=2565925 RepID=A0A4S4BRD9_9BACL|nr:Hsp70 family protein [Cohnella fermenti]THF77566.1 heat-shock protein Hsp70 [Cohnella fermenti]